MPFYDFPGTFLSVIAGRHYESKHIVHWETSELSIEVAAGRKKILTDIDGEEGDVLPMTVKLLPQKLKVVCTK
jgi:diacylglycerol kinase family enzyme